MPDKPYITPLPGTAGDGTRDDDVPSVPDAGAGASFHEEIPFADHLFPIRINRDTVMTAGDGCTPLSWHEQLEILVLLEGRARVVCDVRRLDCEAGDVVIINPCEAHTVEWAGGTLRYHCLMIDPSLYDSADDVCSIRYIRALTEKRVRFNNRVSDGSRAAVRAVLDELLDETRTTPVGYEMTVKGDILRLFALLFRTEQDTDAPRTRGSGEMIQLAPALRYIAENYAQEISLSALAAACCMNRSYFCRRFHALMGRTTVEYVNEYRLAKAHGLLLNTSMTVSEIALSTGFSDSSYFTKRFRARYGVSPSRVRREPEGAGW